MQLEPHFLFNTLNAIHAHVRSAPALAEEMLGHLGSVLRAVLSTNAAPERPLRDELTLVRDLLRIHEVRFGARLQVVVESTAEADSAIVPSLLLQPLVENSIVHGASRRPGPVAVRVSAHVDGSLLHVTVEDSGAAHLPAAGTESGHRIGLANTTQRLHHHFGTDATLRLDVQEARTLVRLVLPFRLGGTDA
jgi:two-component system, LytTR family, sensor kinase